MGALTPLDNTSLSFEFSPTPSGVDQGQEYSFFSDHLSPLSQDPIQARPPLPENSFKETETEEENKFRLFAPSEESQPKKRIKLFAEKTSKSKTDKGDPKSPNSLKNADTAASTQKSEANNVAKASGKNPANKTQQVKNEGDVLAILKKDVKNILNNIPKQVSQQSGTSKGSAPLPKGATLRVEPAAHSHTQKTKAQPTKKATLQTTVAHLSSRDKQNAIGRSSSEVIQKASTEPQQKSTKSPSGEIQIHAGVSNKNATPEAILSPVKKQARTVKKGRTEQRSALNKDSKQASQKETALPRFIPLDKLTDAHANPAAPSDRLEGSKHFIDTARPDTDANPNQMGKGAAKNHAPKSSGAKLQHLARTSRATNWLKTLSERTSMLDKTNPQWKILEMKLEKGNGSMIVRVMKEDDHVSVAVNFSDPDVKSLAETHYREILKELENQYQQEVKFTFNEQGHSSFESFSSATSHKSKSRPLLQPIEKPNQETKAPEKRPSSSDHKVWIG